MVQQIISFLAPFIVRQIDKFGHSLNWEEILVKANERVAKLIPGEMFDEMAIAAVDKCINAVKELLQDEVELTKLSNLCQSKQWAVAIKDLQDYMISKIV